MQGKRVLACVGVLGASLIGPDIAMAQSNAKQNPARRVEVKKVFGYYDLYLRLPPQERDGFAVSYRLNSPAGREPPQLIYNLRGVRSPVQVGPNGKILTLPNAAMLQNGIIEIGAGQAAGSVTMDLEAIVPLSRTIKVADASNPVNDYAAALRRAGPLSMLAPKLTAIVFKGGSGGDAVFADGRRVALVTVPGGVKFQPSAPAMRGAVTLSFTAPPEVAEFAR